MTDNEKHKKVDFDNIAIELDRMIQMENREMITKGLMQSDIRKSLRVYVRSNDHNPPHFHVESKQRHYKQKFATQGIINISKYQDNKFDLYIKKFFGKRVEFLNEINDKFYKLNPNLV